MKKPEKKEIFAKSLYNLSSLLKLKIRRILSPDFNFNVKSKYSADDITQ
jgi:hypothetical protein